MINGIIFQRDDNREYKGVEGDNWYLNNIFPELFEDFLVKILRNLGMIRIMLMYVMIILLLKNI